MIILTSPEFDEYVPMDDREAINRTTGDETDEYTMGIAPDRNCTTADVANYIFKKTEGIADFSFGNQAPWVHSNIYAVDRPNDDWGPGNHPAGNWNLFIQDVASGDKSAIGDFKVTYCGSSCDSTVTENPVSGIPAPERCEESDLDQTDILVPPVQTTCPSCFACLSACESCTSFQFLPSDCIDMIDSSFCNECDMACNKDFQCGCSYDFDVNADAVDSNDVFDLTFSLNEVSFIESIEVELAHWYASDLEITLTAPDGTQYIPMFDTKSISNSESFKLGAQLLTQGTQSSLSNVAPYVFVAAGGKPAFPDGLAPSSTYNAEAWDSGPHAPGEWTFKVTDDTILLDPTSIGSVSISYCGSCGRKSGRRKREET